MPAAAWPGTVQEYAYRPFPSVILSRAVLPGEMTAVLWPAILKSWPSLPLLTSLKMNLPCRAEVRESLNLNSVAVTVTPLGNRAACERVARAGPASAAAAMTGAANTIRRAASEERSMIPPDCAPGVLRASAAPTPDG